MKPGISQYPGTGQHNMGQMYSSLDLFLSCNSLLTYSVKKQFKVLLAGDLLYCSHLSLNVF